MKARAGKRGLLFGTAIDTEGLRDPRFRAVLLREFSAVTLGYEMKWGFTERRRGAREFKRADALVDFAVQHQLHVRGHTLVWHANLPGWLKGIIEEPDAPSVFRNQIDEPIKHFQDRVTDWDILNEVVDPVDGRPDNLRKSPWLRVLGTRFPEEALFRARELMPGAALYYNDYGVEFEVDWQRSRRAPILRFIERLKKAGAPLDGFGIQSHLFASGYAFDPSSYRQFLRDVASFGLRILLTELDCRDNMLPADIGLRDRTVADTTRRVLEVALDEPAVKGVFTWGVADPQSWLNSDPTRKRTDNTMARPLPFDEHYQAKPMWQAIAAAIDAAPGR